MREYNFPAFVEQEISSRLIEVVTTVVFEFSSLQQEMKVELEGRQGENPAPGKPLKTEIAVCFAFGIREHNEGPVVNSLVMGQTIRLRKRNDRDHYAPLIEPILHCLHLSEVLLARQSGEMTQKNNQHGTAGKLPEADLPAFEIEEKNTSQGNGIHPLSNLPKAW
jgi:hypothetical protein